MTKKPMRVFEGKAKPHERFWVVRDAADTQSGETEIELFGVISEYSWFEDDITPKMFKDDLYTHGGGKPVTILMHSPGGDIFAASVIRSIIQDYPGRVTVDIVGLAASAATIVISGADHIRMRESAMMMIHDPSTLAWGTIEEIKKMLDVLKTIKTGIVETYQTKTGLEAEKLAKMMTDETWMTPREAMDLGFVDEVVAGKATKAALPEFSNCLELYDHVPAALMAAEEEEPDETSVNEPPELGTSDQPEADKNERDDAEECQLRDYLKIFG